MSGKLKGQEAYQRNYMLRRKKIQVTRILLFVVFLMIWQSASDLGWIDSFIFSSPTELVGTFFDMYHHHDLMRHIGVTLLETLASFALVGVVTVLVSVLLWSFPAVSEILEPCLVILNALPKSALAPLLIVWLGANQRTIILAGMSVAVFGSIMNLSQGFGEVSKDKMKLIYTLGGNRRQVLTKVVLPASVPYLISILKVDIGLCLVGVVIGEFIGAREGLGYLIIYSSQVFKLSWLLLSIVLLCIMAMVLYQLICLVQKRKK
ncbi:MAG: ABC transporter permease [Lachnospiraceae bacterium]|nr:ABC transporter permease [Lachnospiraceae bacterium]